MFVITLLACMVSAVLYIVSIWYYKNIFNPLGIFTIIWGSIPFLYDLKLSYYFEDLHIVTYFAVYISLIFFILGCISKTKYSYKKKIELENKKQKNRRKALMFYGIFLLMALVEIVIQTPPLLSSNPFLAYMEGGGVRFLHFVIVLLPLAYVYIILFIDVKKIMKLVLFIPAFSIPVVWMQRGHLIWFLLMLIFVISTSYSIGKQLKVVSISIVVVFIFVNFLGNYRTKANFESMDVSNLSELAGTGDLPPFISWGYMYFTASLQNIDQTLVNEEVKYKFGYDIVKPVFSLLQIKQFDKILFDGEFKRTFTVKAGFNVPTYLHWIFLNFGYIGFIIVPFLLGRVSQIFYNRALNGERRGIFLYAFWMPFLVQSFHDFLFWNVGVIVIFGYIFILKYYLTINKRLLV